MEKSTMWPSSEEKRFFPPSIKPLRVASSRRVWISSRRSWKKIWFTALSAEFVLALPRIPRPPPSTGPASREYHNLSLLVQLADSSKSFCTRSPRRWFLSWLGSPVTRTISGFFCGQIYARNCTKQRLEGKEATICYLIFCFRVYFSSFLEKNSSLSYKIFISLLLLYNF